MNRNKWLLIIFVLLALATGWYFYGKGGPTESTLGWDRNFKVENEDEIYKIFIARRDSITTTLERQGDHWIINGKYKARPNAMHNILEAVTKLELQYVPPKAAYDNIVREMAARGIKVEVYGKSGKLLKSYYVGGVTADARGTYMLMEGSEQPMVMGLHNMEGQIRTRYDMVGDDWRDRTVFGYKADDIQAVSIEYPTNKNKSFKLRREGNDYVVEPFYENQLRIDQPVDKASVEAFLYNFESLIAENFINDQPNKEELNELLPFAIVSVTDKDGNERKVKFTPKHRINAATGERKTDIVERYYLFLNDGDLMLGQHRVFQKIFWPYDAFFLPPSAKVKG
ncbi:MAG: hypothetical protein Kow0027_25150 [Saprospiraceae bacterium]